MLRRLQQETPSTAITVCVLWLPRTWPTPSPAGSQCQMYLAIQVPAKRTAHVRRLFFPPDKWKPWTFAAPRALLLLSLTVCAKLVTQPRTKLWGPSVLMPVPCLTARTAASASWLCLVPTRQTIRCKASGGTHCLTGASRAVAVPVHTGRYPTSSTCRCAMLTQIDMQASTCSGASWTLYQTQRSRTPGVERPSPLTPPPL